MLDTLVEWPDSKGTPITFRRPWVETHTKISILLDQQRFTYQTKYFNGAPEN